MKTKIFISFLFVSFRLSFCFVKPVLAHGDEPRLEVSLKKSNPGGVVEVHSLDFEFEERVSLVLIGSGVEIPLSEIVADTEGVF